MARILVTGASRGIGRALCARLVEGGHEVIGLVRPQSVSSVADLGLASVVEADLADIAALPAALSSSGLTDGSIDGPSGGPIDGPSGGPIDGLAHCAGIVRAGPLSSTTAADFRDQFEVNVTAVAELTRLLLPSLQRSSLPTVVFVNSGSGLNAREPLAAYGASKFALRAYADALRLAEPWLRVSSFFPGRTATDMQRIVREAEDGSYDERDYLAVSTVVSVLELMLLLPADGVLTEVSLRPRTH